MWKLLGHSHERHGKAPDDTTEPHEVCSGEQSTSEAKPLLILHDDHLRKRQCLRAKLNQTYSLAFCCGLEQRQSLDVSGSSHIRRRARYSGCRCMAEVSTLRTPMQRPDSLD